MSGEPRREAKERRPQFFSQQTAMSNRLKNMFLRKQLITVAKTRKSWSEKGVFVGEYSYSITVEYMDLTQFFSYMCL